MDLELFAVDDVRVLVGPGQFGILRIKSIRAVAGDGAGGAGKSDNPGEGQVPMQLLFGTGGAKKSESPVPVDQAAGEQFLHYRPAGMRFGDPLLVWRDGVCVYHVFYLKAKSSPPEELIFAHVSSRDLLHWKEKRTCQCAAARDAPADFYLEAELRIAPGARALFVLRGKTDTLVEAPVAVLVDPAAETVAFTQRNLWGSCNPLSAAAVAHHDFTSGAEVFVQMILRGEILEVFFDERHSLSMRIDREKGALGLFAREDLAARIVPPPPVGGLWAALEDFLPARKTTVASDRQVFWLAFTANGIPHLLVVLDGDQPAASVQVQGFPADTLIVGDARSFAKNEEGCVLTDVTTHALIKGRP